MLNHAAEQLMSKVYKMKGDCISVYLEISELHGGGTLWNSLWGILQSSSCFLFTVRSNNLPILKCWKNLSICQFVILRFSHLGSRFSSSLCLGCHGSLELNRKTTVFAVNNSKSLTFNWSHLTNIQSGTSLQSSCQSLTAWQQSS